VTDCRCLSHNGFLTRAGLARVAQREQVDLSLEGLTPMGEFDTLTGRGSVSGLRRDEDLCDYLLDEQYRRFHNGS